MGEDHIVTAFAYGGQGHDIIYGADDSATVVIYGDKDYGYGIGSSLTTGGKDKIYGGDNNASVTIYGAADDDKIWTGSENTVIVVYGDSDCLGGGTDCHGDDIITVEDANDNVTVYG